MPIIALFATWKQLGFYVLLYLAALQNIPEELYEAAEVDGAGSVKRFTAVTLPGVRPTTTLVVITGHHHRGQLLHRAVPAHRPGRPRTGRRCRRCC